MNVPADETAAIVQEPTSAPRFSLFCLMTVLTAFAVVFGFQEGSLNLNTLNPSDPFWKGLFRTSEVLISTFCLAGLAIVIREAFLTKRFLPHPGYLILLALGSWRLLGLLSNYFFGIDAAEYGQLINGANDNLEANLVQRIRILQWTQALVAAIAGICYVTGVFRYRWWWRICFGLLALAMTCMLAISVYQQVVVTNGGFQDPASVEFFVRFALVGNIAIFISYGTILIAAICDLVTKTKRNWLHWCGVLLGLVFLFVPWLLVIVAQRFLSVSELFQIPGQQ